MVKQFEKLAEHEKKLLFKAPVLVAVLASSTLNEINRSSKAYAIKLSHLKTIATTSVLLPFYIEAEKNYKELFEETVKEYAPFDEAKRNELKKEIHKMDLIINKLDESYAQQLRKSLEGYARHVKSATHSVFQDFLFPIPIQGLSN